MEDRYDPSIHKIFIIDYVFMCGQLYPLGEVHSHLTFATGRNSAEWNTKKMEKFSNIKILKSICVPQSQEFHDIVDERLATLKEQNTNFDPNYMRFDEDSLEMDREEAHFDRARSRE